MIRINKLKIRMGISRGTMNIGGASISYADETALKFSANIWIDTQQKVIRGFNVSKNVSVCFH